MQTRREFMKSMISAAITLFAVSRTVERKPKENLRLIEVKRDGKYVKTRMKDLQEGDKFRVDGVYIYKALDKPFKTKKGIWSIKCKELITPTVQNIMKT